MTITLYPPTTIEQLNELCHRDGEEKLLTHIGNVGALIRLDERGGEGEELRAERAEDGVEARTAEGEAVEQQLQRAARRREQTER